MTEPPPVTGEVATRPLPRPAGAEVLANLMLGPDAHAVPLPTASPGGVSAALEPVLAGALERQPCVVSFSGGRDSSAVLALAADCARRHGLPLPVPVIMRFPGMPAIDESAWQELVLAHLRLENAEIVTLSDELDALGATATAVLRRHGLLWPGNVYMHEPVLALARGGSLLTGIGGDELLSTRADRRSALRLAVAALPVRLRESIWLARHRELGYGWLTPAGLAQVRRGLAREEVACPYPWDQALGYWYASRSFAATVGSLRLLAEDRDVALVNPLLDPQVLAEIGQEGGPTGFSSRAVAMEWLCGDLLPPAVITRATKASFGGAVWEPVMRHFVADWDGTGLDPHDVDAGRLRAQLSRAEPDFRTVLLLQQAWLSAQGSSSSPSSVVSS